MTAIKNLLDRTVDDETCQRLLHEIKDLNEGDRFNLGINGIVVNEVVFNVEEDHVKTLRYGVEGTMLTRIREVTYDSHGSFITGVHDIGTKNYHKLLEIISEACTHA